MKAVILAAGLAKRLWPMTLMVPKAFIPVGGCPAIVHIILRLQRVGVKEICIVVGNGKEFEFNRMLSSWFGNSDLKISFIVQEQPNGPGEAFALTKSFVTDNLLLVLTDTLCDIPTDFSRDWIGVDTFDIGSQSQWCVVQTDSTGLVLDLFDRPNAWKNERKAAVGIYFFRMGNALKNAMTTVLTDRRLRCTKDGVQEIELSHIIDSYRVNNPMFAHKINGWHDLGTLHSYNTAITTLLPKRSFTKLEISPAGTVRKSSSQIDLSAEAQWYRRQGSSEHILSPQIYHQASDNSDFEIDYIDYPTLAEIFVFGLPEPQTWQYIASRLVSLLRGSLWSKRPGNDTVDTMASRACTMYIDKTVNRLRKWERGDLIDLDKVYINGLEYNGFSSLWPRIVEQLFTLATVAPRFASVIHGDLVFSNVLYSLRSSIFRLIDPRGDFGGSLEYGDSRYDAAKLRQSYHGHYEVILHDLFEIQQSAHNSFTFREFPTYLPCHSILDSLLVDLGFNVSDLRVIEGILFLSLIPLHGESEDRQIAFFLRGLQCLNDTA